MLHCIFCYSGQFVLQELSTPAHRSEYSVPELRKKSPEPEQAPGPENSWLILLKLMRIMSP